MVDETFDDNNSDMAYDLRQRYAKIVGDHMEDVAHHRKANSYFSHFESLKDLYIVVRHKIKDDGNKGYTEFCNKIAALANKYPDTFTCKNRKDVVAVVHLEMVLGEFEMWIYAKMEEVKMFGQKGYGEEDDE